MSWLKAALSPWSCAPGPRSDAPAPVFLRADHRLDVGRSPSMAASVSGTALFVSSVVGALDDLTLLVSPGDDADRQLGGPGATGGSFGPPVVHTGRGNHCKMPPGHLTVRGIGQDVIQASGVLSRECRFVVLSLPFWSQQLLGKQASSIMD